MPAALILTALLAVAPAQTTVAPGLWRLTTEPLFMPPHPDNISARIVETVCVGQRTGLDPSTLKPPRYPADAADMYRRLQGDPSRAYRIEFGGVSHGRLGFNAYAKRIGKCPKSWSPGARRKDKTELFPAPTPEQMEAFGAQLRKGERKDRPK